MTSNSNNMTFEEKIVQKIKEQTLGMFTDDELAITEMAKRAVSEALLQDRYDPNDHGYNRKKIPSPSMLAAKEAAEIAAKSIVGDIVKQLQESKEFSDAVKEYLSDVTPKVLEHMMREGFQSMMTKATNDAENNIRIAIMNGQYK